MNFDEAVLAHSNWKTKLARYLRRPDGSLDPDEIQRDNQCALGKWIHGEATSWAGQPDFEALRAAHARFHRAASDIVRRANGGARVEAALTLGGQSEYAQASTAVVQAILQMRRRAESG